MREILHLQVGQGGNHIGAKVSRYLAQSITLYFINKRESHFLFQICLFNYKTIRSSLTRPINMS